MTIFRWVWFKVVFWLKYRRSDREFLKWAVLSVDKKRNAEWQPLKGRDKFNSAILLAMNRYGKKQPKNERQAGKFPYTQESMVAAVEWAVQAVKGRKFVSTRQIDGRLNKIYKKRLRSDTDSRWGIDDEHDERAVVWTVRGIAKDGKTKA